MKRYPLKFITFMFIFIINCGQGMEGLFDSQEKTSVNWYDQNWQYRMAITIDSGKVVSSHADFPVLVHFSTQDSLRDNARNDGFDILFTAGNGISKLFHQREDYDFVNGELIAWVRVPVLSDSTDTVIYLYYGNLSAADQANASSVWNSQYRAVWHLSDTTTGADAMKDATSNAFHGEDIGSPLLGSAGKIGNAIDFDGTDDYIDLGTANIIKGISPFTISAWVSIDTSSGEDNDFAIWDRRDDLENNGVGLAIGDWEEDDSYLKVISNKGAVWNDYFSSAQVPVNSWIHVAAVYDSTETEIIVYIGGLPGTPSSYALPGNVDDLSQCIGQSGSTNGNFFDGTIDELRISTTARSADWINTSFQNQGSPAAFYSVAAPEMKP